MIAVYEGISAYYRQKETLEHRFLLALVVGSGAIIYSFGWGQPTLDNRAWLTVVLGAITLLLVLGIAPLFVIWLRRIQISQRNAQVQLNTLRVEMLRAWSTQLARNPTFDIGRGDVPGRAYWSLWMYSSVVVVLSLLAALAVVSRLA